MQPFSMSANWNYNSCLPMEILIESSKKSAVSRMELFLTVFSFVPDDKLNWTPSPTAKSALRIAAHTAVTAGNFAKMIRARKLPMGDEIPELVARTAAATEALKSRAEIEEVFRKNTDEVLAALDTLTSEDVTSSLDSSQGWSMPMTFLMDLPGMHASTHTGQIDYLQTCWGDQDVHF